MLDELGAAMVHTDSRMNNVMKKLAKLTKLEDGRLISFYLIIANFQKIDNVPLFLY